MADRTRPPSERIFSPYAASALPKTTETQRSGSLMFFSACVIRACSITSLLRRTKHARRLAVSGWRLAGKADAGGVGPPTVNRQPPTGHIQSRAMSSAPPVRPITIADIRAAHDRIRGVITRTPLVRLLHGIDGAPE